MNNQLEQAALSTSNSETVLAPEDPALASLRWQDSRPQREIGAGSGPHLSRETQALLRSWQRATALILLVGFAAFLVRHVAGLLAGEPVEVLVLAAQVLV